MSIPSDKMSDITNMCAGWSDKRVVSSVTFRFFIIHYQVCEVIPFFLTQDPYFIEK